MTEPTLFPTAPRFDGAGYDPAIDHVRLTRQIKRIFDLMSDASWRTLQEIADITGDPAASVSAQLRHLRKKKFGSWVVNKRRRTPCSGLWEYQLLGFRDGDA